MTSLHDEERRALHRDIRSEADTLSLMAPPTQNKNAMATVNRIVSSGSGASRLVWLGIRHNHPDTQVETIEELFSDAEIFAAAMSEFDRVNEQGAKKKGTTKTKARRRKSR